ncbi:HesA/MoeB/ThiF family protein [Vibrio methylphosphonaticus]|uniref:HesA/MoeB/ThiF family protein n=1 Tax=Vibrio methylphosphonaticus TaxID=2946866 RepID=UPI002029CFF6|nr:HesA/MoeB/ThiF family protein [Vibrio methylphosphonaticus]MCL9777384.1 HesA/MoeB/ThiF family protein [Vibrio methylphosphonaticus]
MVLDNQFQRYVRQISVPEIAERGQENLLSSHVLVIGCGGLGTAASLYLAGAGIGRLVIADQDIVERSNLPRQIAYREEDVGTPKVAALKQQLLERNEDVSIRTINTFLTGNQLKLEVSLADVVIDCSDNLATRHAINHACYETKTNLVSGAAIGWNGQLTVFSFVSQPSIPCYRCLYPFDDMSSPTDCSSSGVVGPVVGMIGIYSALEAIKIASGRIQSVSPTLKMFNGLNGQWQSLKLHHDPECKVCASGQKESIS